MGQGVIHQSQINGDDDHQEEHHPGGPQGLLAVGPGDLFQLTDYFQGELLGLGRISLDRGQLAEPRGPGLAGPQFVLEVVSELKKVTWPNRKETLGATGVVLILVIIVSIYLGLVDYALSHLVRVLIR